jgi:hypothetical protein
VPAGPGFGSHARPAYERTNVNSNLDSMGVGYFQLQPHLGQASTLPGMFAPHSKQSRLA